MGLTIWNTRYTGWQSGNYLVTTVCCFPCTGKEPCILVTFDYYTIKPDNCPNGSGVSGLELSHIVLFFPSSLLCSKIQHIIYSYDACYETLSVYPHRASLKNMPDHSWDKVGGNDPGYFEIIGLVF
jgi:hypothetical protein